MVNILPAGPSGPHRSDVTYSCSSPHRDHQCRGAPPERVLRQPTDEAVTRNALAAAAPTPLVRVAEPTGQHRPAGLQALPKYHQAEPIKTANVVRSGMVKVASGTSRSFGQKA